MSTICQEKLLEKDPTLLYEGRHYPLATLENHKGLLYAPLVFARKCRLKLVNIIEFGKKGLYDRIGQWSEALYKT